MQNLAIIPFNHVKTWVKHIKLSENFQRFFTAKIIG